MSMKDYYKILGLNSQASMIDIREAYKSLSLKLHPDQNRHDPHTTQRFQELLEAYSVLSDYHKRRQYDNQREVTVLQPTSVHFPTFDFSSFGHTQNFRDFNSMFPSIKFPDLSQFAKDHNHYYTYGKQQSTTYDKGGSQSHIETRINRNGQKQHYVENIMRDPTGKVIKHTKTPNKKTP